MALSGTLAAPSAYAVTCYPGSANWDATNWQTFAGCAATGPVAGDSVTISSGTLSLNGVSTPTLANLYISSSATLNDAGPGPGSLTTTTLATLGYNGLLDFTQNNSTFTASGSGITLGTWWNTIWLSSIAKFGTGTVTLAGNIVVYPDEDAPNVQGKFTMNSGGTLEFTTSSNISAYANGTNIAVITLQGTAGTPLILKTAGTTTFTAPTLANTTAGGGTYNLDYVHFATGTWVVDPSVTVTEPANCTYATGVTLPAAWTGCSSIAPPSPPVSASIGLTTTEPARVFTQEIISE